MTTVPKAPFATSPGPLNVPSMAPVMGSLHRSLTPVQRWLASMSEGDAALVLRTASTHGDTPAGLDAATLHAVARHWEAGLPKLHDAA